MYRGTLLPDVLQQRAAEEPGTRAYVFLNEDGAESVALTVGELHARALDVAGRLRAVCAPGDRALLMFPQSLDFIVAYFGCLYAGVVAVPVNPPRRNKVQDATRSIVRDCAPAAVLTIGTMRDSLRETVESLCGPLHWIPVDRPDTDRVDGIEPYPSTPDTLAFLQYTSGSTSAPKGVMVSHGNLATNQEMIRDAFGHDRESTVVGWAPFFHDQGLIGNVLQPLYVGATAILMSPMAFIRRPLLWLSTISKYRAHTSGGPNFAFDACVAHAARTTVPELDLSCWKVAFNGAEPIRPETLHRFGTTFAPHGFRCGAHYPCYGLAESTLLVTGSRKGRGPIVVAADTDELAHRRLDTGSDGPGRILVGSGTPLPHEQVRIVDPETGKPRADNEVGEIWISGGHVAQGYWRRPEATAETFRATCADEPDRTYLRTGDLGVMTDGELYVVGRIKDVLIIRGRNYYPQDIEQTAVSAHSALRLDGCAAFSVPGDDGEQLVLVQEIKRVSRSEADPDDVRGSIRAAITQEHQLSVRDIVLTTPGQLAKTSSGKIMRGAARKRYQDGEFAVWTPKTTSAA